MERREFLGLLFSVPPAVLAAAKVPWVGPREFTGSITEERLRFDNWSYSEFVIEQMKNYAALHEAAMAKAVWSTFVAGV